MRDFEAARKEHEPTLHGLTGDRCGSCREKWPCTVTALIAEVFAGRERYDKLWDWRSDLIDEVDHLKAELAAAKRRTEEEEGNYVEMLEKRDNEFRRAETAEAQLSAEREGVKRYASKWRAELERAERLEKAGRLLLDAYGEAHALHDLGECEGSLLMREALHPVAPDPQLQHVCGKQPGACEAYCDPDPKPRDESNP